MDPVSQGAVGAAFAQSAAKKENIILIGFIGFLAGLAPDLDVLIRSEDDPILFLEYHRQFSHSLFFIPIGSFFVALFIFPFVRGLMSLRMVYIASFLGYATHGLLDACTSYGTQLFWPFSDQRVTWNNISIVDPLFTIPVLILVVIAIKTKKKIFSFFSIGWIIFYLSLGFIQYERALLAAVELAQVRGHSPERLTLKPSFGNLILWKSIYQHNETFYVDAIRTAQSSTWCLGESIRVFDYQYHLPDLDEKSQQKTDVNEVEGAGNTPLHGAAYDGWLEGIELLAKRGARLDASNNAGDTPWQWAANMRHDEACDLLEKLGADKDYRGRVIVPEHIPKVKDFYELEDGRDHPLPSQEFLEWQKEQDRARDATEAANWDAWSAPGNKKQ